MAEENPTPTSAQELQAQYDHGTAGDFEPVLSPSEVRAATSTPEPARQPPPRDPDSGRFTKPQAQHSPRVMRMAQRLGVPESRIALMSPEALEDVVETLQDHLLTQRQNIGSPQWQPQQQPPGGPAPTPPPTPREEEFTVPGLKDETWDAELGGQLKTAFKALMQRNKELEGRLAAVEQQSIATRNMTFAQRVDALIDSWGDERFGKGSVHGMAPDSPEASKRYALVREAIRLSGQNGTDETALSNLKRARDLLYGEATPPSPRNGRITPEQWNGAGLVRPTNRAGAKSPDQKVRATEAVRQAMQDMETTPEEIENALRGPDDDVP